MLPIRLLSLVIVAVLSSCGGSGPHQNYSDTPPSSRFVAGAACDSSSDCGDGMCSDNWPGGSCFKSCTRDSDCGAGGACAGFSDGKHQCVQACKPGTSSCRAGYVCEAFSNVPADGFCAPEKKQFI